MRPSCIEKGRTNLSSMYFALRSKKAFAACTSFCEGLRDEIRLGKVISVTKNVGQSKRVGSDETVAVEKTAVGEGVPVAFGPCLEYVVVFFVRYLCKVSDEERRGRGKREETKRRAETGDNEFRKWAENVEDYGAEEEDEEEGKGGHGSNHPRSRTGYMRATCPLQLQPDATSPLLGHLGLSTVRLPRLSSRSRHVLSLGLSQ